MQTMTKATETVSAMAPVIDGCDRSITDVDTNRATDVRELSCAEIEATAGGAYAFDLISKYSGGSGFRIFGRDAICWTL
jgi:hypothetical protein